MLSVARLARHARPPCSHSFVSSVLLTRTWENETVNTLRDEAKRRGLSSKGNKATLILRIQNHEKRVHVPKSHTPTLPESSAPAPAPAPTPALAPASQPQPRHASTVASPPAAAHEEGVAPGIPPAAESHATPPAGLVFQLNIPDISQPDSLPEAQIPYVPDFWSSSTPQNPEPEAASPVMVVVGGEGTHLLSPTHNLLSSEPDAAIPPVETSSSVPSSQSSQSGGQVQGGVWDDIAEDIGLPPPNQIKQAFWKIFS